MEITFTPEIEAKLKNFAMETGREPVQVVEELVAVQLDYEEWFRREVAKGFASLDRGEFVSHDEMGQRMNRTPMTSSVSSDIFAREILCRYQNCPGLV